MKANTKKNPFAEPDFPAFWGCAGQDRIADRAYQTADGNCAIWPTAPGWIRLWATGGRIQKSRFYSAASNDDLSVFVWGHPVLAEDAEFGRDARIRSLAQPCAEQVLNEYQRIGEKTFVQLDGAFSLIVLDRRKQTAFLVADKFGCEGVYFRPHTTRILFASHPQILQEDECDFDPLAAAFFLAQEGFVPAPFTLFRGIRSMGRGKLLRIAFSNGEMRTELLSYWQVQNSWKFSSRRDAVQALFPALTDALESRRASQSGILFSGGIDSSLLLQIAARREKQDLIALTGAIRGHCGTAGEAREAAAIANAVGVAHETVTLDPRDEGIPDDWQLCLGSSPNGTRASMPLFLRMAHRFRDLLGPGCSVFSGQMADTLAENNYTLPSWGYMMRRLFFSPGFLKASPLLARILRRPESLTANSLRWLVRRIAGPRFAEMFESLLDGLRSPERFYGGRIFGYGEMPGCSARAFPMLTPSGFKSVAEWYISSFIRPRVERLNCENLRREMIEMSFDMVMLYLDTRLVHHAMRLGGVRAELPFLDARIVNYFASLPESAHALWRSPKYVIREQFRRIGGLPLKRFRPRRSKRSREQRSIEQLLLQGSLGMYFREMLAGPILLTQIPRFFELLNQSWFEEQLQLFRRGASETDWKFICRLAALEWQVRQSAQRLCGANEPISTSVMA